MTLAFELALDITLVAFLIALVIGVIGIFSKWKGFSLATVTLLSAGLLTLTTYIIARWSEAGRPPFSNMFESMVLFSWAIVAIYLVMRVKIRIRAFDAAASFAALVTLVYATSFESDIKPLMPALQHNYWLTFHVFTCFLGYAGFALSFLAGIGYLITMLIRVLPDQEDTSSINESLGLLEMAISKTIAFGFLFLTVGIISGAVWANSAWGSYWTWDPKETWSLITWIIYALFLHCRFMRGWKGPVTAVIAIVGFAAVLFTYFGVNFLLSGLHSYA